MTRLSTGNMSGWPEIILISVFTGIMSTIAMMLFPVRWLDLLVLCPAAVSIAVLGTFLGLVVADMWGLLHYD